MVKRRGLSPGVKIGLAVAVIVLALFAATRPSESPKPEVAATGTSLERSTTTSGGVASQATTTTDAPTAGSIAARDEPSQTSSPAPSGAVPDPQAAAASAPELAARLAALPAGSLDWSHPYSRDQFGPAWSDTDHNGCDTRNDILHRDLTAVVTRDGTHGCVVIAGQLADPYTGGVIPFVKAEASKVQIDHLIPLHAAWQLGAWQWSAQARLTYANDPRVLLAVSGSQNESKSDSLAGEWRPPNRGFWCSYAARTITVHEAYRLPVTTSERAALSDMISTCAPGAGSGGPGVAPQPFVAETAPTPQATVAPQTAPATAPPPPPPPSGTVTYANCAAVRAAGAAPLYAGQPGYSTSLDRDRDGVACE